MYSVILFIVSCTVVRSEFYDSYSGEEITSQRYDSLSQIGLVPFCAIEVLPCDPHEPRRMDASCNNLKYPPRGATLTPYHRLLPPVFSAGGGLRTAKSGKSLPLVRPLRVALVSDGRVASERYTQMVANLNVFITGDITSVHDTVNYVAVTRTCCQPGGDQDPRCIPVKVEEDDLHLRRSSVRCLNLTRALTYQRLGCLSEDVPPERINTAAPLLELSSVYGHEERGARKGREFKGGRLRAEVIKGKEWPPSGGRVCVNNQQPRETRCHDAPSSGSNSVLGLNLVFIWLYRGHNAISRSLQELNPCWNDDRLYYTAREINIAFFNHITYYEMMTELLGWDFLVKNKVVFPTLGHVNDYDPGLEPRVSIEYITGTRWFHTLQEGRLKLYTKDGRVYDNLAAVDFILRTGALPLNNTIEGITQGAFRQPGAAGGPVVDPDVSERILGRLQLASDVLSSDIMKGRDLGLPPYNEYRKLCGLPEAKRFEDLLGWMDRPQVEAMASFYEHPDDVEVMAALLAERPARGAAVGATLRCLMAHQLLLWRRSDRFWYEHQGHPGAFTAEQLYEIRKMTLAKLICKHGDDVDAVQPHAFLVPGPGNEITNCSKYEMPNLDVFRDDGCYPRPTLNPKKLSEGPPIENQYANFERNFEFMDNPLLLSYNNYIKSNSAHRHSIPDSRNTIFSTYQENPSISKNLDYYQNRHLNLDPNNVPYPNAEVPKGTKNQGYSNTNHRITANSEHVNPSISNNQGHVNDKPLWSYDNNYSNANPFHIFF